jgi:uncharacterized protein (DUF58 family)
MGPVAKTFFFGMLVVFIALALVAALAGWWIYGLASLLLAIAFCSSAPFVLGRGWRAPEPKPTRRPVVRRR